VHISKSMETRVRSIFLLSGRRNCKVITKRNYKGVLKSCLEGKAGEVCEPAGGGGGGYQITKIKGARLAKCVIGREGENVSSPVQPK